MIKKIKTIKTTKPAKVNKKFGYLVVILGSLLLVGALCVAIFQISRTHTNEVRKDRIVAIYDSLKLGDEYQQVNSDVFGDKRVYDWDAGRTYSSSKEYVRAANVDVTIADLKKSIEAAGFHYFDEPYPGGWSYQYHFKSDKNEYIRLSVTSKPKWDAARDEALMNKESPTFAFHSLDSNAGPSNVTIKVNLDDNNE